MTDTAAILALLLIPILTSVIKTDQRGLLTGLFISLYFLSALHPALPLVPLAAAVTVFILRRPAADQLSGCIIVKSPAIPFFMVFFFTMLIFCALSGSVFQYGVFLQTGQRVLLRARQLSALAVLLGPLLFGRLCDRRGPFQTAVLLSLMAELSVLFITAVDHAAILFYIGSFLLSLSVSGFFTAAPLAAAAFQGQRQFLLTYPFLLPPAILFYAGSQYLTGQSESFQNPGDFMLALLLLSCLSAFFLLLSWKRRLVLVTDRRIS